VNGLSRRPKGLSRGLAAVGQRQLKRAPTPIEFTQAALQTGGMAKKPEPPQLATWSIYKIAARQTWIGAVEASDEAVAIEKAAEQFKVPATKLMATRRQ
jgi:hypothetical protein